MKEPCWWDTGSVLGLCGHWNWDAEFLGLFLDSVQESGTQDCQDLTSFFHLLLCLQAVKLGGVMHIQCLLSTTECLGLTRAGDESDKNYMCLQVPSCHKNLYHMMSTALEEQNHSILIRGKSPLSFSLEEMLKQISSN